MKENRPPHCYVIAGPNGAGKTTFALTYLPRIVSCYDFINADEIAKGLSPLDFDAAVLKAGKIYLETLSQKIKARKDFAFETTLSGLSYISRIQDWRKSGWKVFLFYLYVPNAAFSENRVQQRVLQGGHNIPKEVIYRRFPRSMRNLFEYADVCDQTFCIDNTGSNIVLIFEKHSGEPLVIFDEERFSRLQGGLKHD